MAFARVVSFEGVSKDRMEEMQREMGDGKPPEGFPSGDFLALYDADGERSLVIFIFETEEDYRRADEILNAMPTGDTPGRQTSVARYDLAMRMKT